MPALSVLLAGSMALGCQEAPAPDPGQVDATSSQSFAEALDAVAELAVTHAAAEDDTPRVEIQTPVSSTQLRLPDPDFPQDPAPVDRMPIQLVFNAINVELTQGGNRAHVSLDGNRVATLFSDAPTVLLDVLFGQHRLCIQLADEAGAPLTNPESRACTLFRVIKHCRDSSECEDTRSCNTTACIGRVDKFGFSECRYGPPENPLCCDSADDCPFNWKCDVDVCVECTTDGDCDDGRACTDDICNANKRCENNLKTGPEYGAFGVCCDNDEVCSDGDRCTIDSCNFVTNTCNSVPDPNPKCCNEDIDCDDNLFCTIDRCFDGVCRRGPSPPGCCDIDDDCNDGNPCTIDACDESVKRCVVSVANTGGCCLFSSQCADENPNTADWCDQDTRSCRNVVPPDYCECPDGQTSCTAAESFGVPEVGRCRPDGQTCTSDLCVNNRCAYPVVAGCCERDSDCFDGDNCTADACIENQCQRTEIANCCDQDSDCADANVCTFDRCSNARCLNVPQNNCCNADADCDDGNVCTEATCVNHQCLVNITTDPGILSSNECCKTAADCDDNNVHTLDFCVNSECGHALSGTCDTDAECVDPTKPCQAGSCVANRCEFTAVPGCCDSDAQCADTDPCTRDVCTANNTCQSTTIQDCCLSDAACDNGNPCDENYCVAGECRTVLAGSDCTFCTPGATFASPADDPCNDGNECTIDSCGQDSKCTHTVDSSNPECCVTAGECDDRNPCTINKCQGNKCRFSEVTTTCCTDDSQCNDNQLCTLDVCVNGLCRNIPPSNVTSAALPDICCGKDSDCPDDGSPCTLEVCNNVGNCEFALADPCEFDLPYIQRFDQFVTFAWYGWTTIDLLPTADTTNNFTLSSAGRLGPDGHVRFNWAPTAGAYDVRLRSPLFDAGGAPVVTVQADIDFTWFQNFTEVTVWVSPTNDWVNDAILIPDAIITLREDFTGFMTQQLPSAILDPQQNPSGKFFLAFGINGLSTYDFDNVDFDNVRVVPGRPPFYVDRPERKTTDRIVARYGVTTFAKVAARDPDNQQVQIGIERIVPAQNSIRLDGTRFNAATGNYEDIFIIDPDSPDDAGEYTVTLKATDSRGLVTFVDVPVTILRNQDYLVWAPDGVPASHVTAITDALTANNRSFQVLDDLTLYRNLDNLTGVFAVLGTAGLRHRMTAAEMTLLRGYLNQGGNIYLESGQAWGDELTAGLKTSFGIQHLSGGPPKLDGTLNGIAHRRTLAFDIAQNPFDNALPDKIDRLNQTGFWNRISEQHAGLAGTITTEVFNDAAGQPGFTGTGYRTVGATRPFASLLPKGTGTRTELMGNYVSFFENGFPPCDINADCNDVKACSNDVCTAGVCSNDFIADCQECTDDRICLTDQACSTAKVCVDIGGEVFASTGPSQFIDTRPDNARVVRRFTIDSSTSQGATIQTFHGVKLDMAHAWSGELEIRLSSDAGVGVILQLPDLTDNRNGVFRTFPVGQGISNGSAADLEGIPLAGNWILEVIDHQPGFNSGVLNGFSLYVTLATVACSNDGDCADSNLCTAEECVNGFCSTSAIDSRDYVFGSIENLCTEDGCQADLGPFHVEKTCNDGSDCTADSCFAPTGECRYRPVLTCPNAGCSTHRDCGVDDYCLPVAATCSPIANDRTRTFRTSGGNLPLSITDGDVNNGTEATVEVSLPQGFNKWFTTNVIVKVEILHSYRSDLEVYLSHNGQRAQLFDIAPGIQDANDNLIAVWDLSEAPADSEAFALLESGDATGTWTLEVFDTEAGDRGDLVTFNLYLEGVPCKTDSDCSDGNACTTDTCDTQNEVTTCNHAAVNCDDGQFCNGTEVCDSATGCQAGTPVTIDDGIGCTADACDEENDVVVNTPRPTLCDDGNPCTNNVCDTTNGCQNPNNTDSCDDGLVCTINDACSGGSCGGDPNPNPVCGCTIAAECPEDPNKCAADYACTNGQCVPAAGTETVCDPGNDTTCATNTCIPATGNCEMVDTAPGIVCSDGSNCTENDRCDGGGNCVGTDRACDDGVYCNGAETCNPANGECVAGTPPSTSDGVNCTVDGCDNGTRTSVNIPDDNACDDNNPCTNDTCDATLGCQNTFNTAPCDDLDPLTDNDVCASGVCAGTAVGQECVRDSDCTDDGNKCNGTQECFNFSCRVKPGSVVTCGAENDTTCLKNTCQPASGTCTMAAVATGTLCDDGNECTGSDACNASGVCAGANIAADCDDGNACNGAETCSPSLGCQPGTPPTADDGIDCTTQICNPDTGQFEVVVDHTKCSDGNGCTDDVCDATNGCTFPNNTASCEDGVACTINDTCAGGSCQAGDPNPVCADCRSNEDCPGHNDGNACNGDTTCVAGTCVTSAAVTCAGAGTACSSIACDPADGLCKSTPKAAGVSCTDGNPCTLNDACDGAGSCEAGDAKQCSDGQFCNGTEFCNVSTGACQNAPSGPDPDDGVPCTLDECDEENDRIVNIQRHTLCDDSKHCTDDFCHPSNGCQNTNNTALCDDGNRCTLNDRCDAGVCEGVIDESGCACSVDADCPQDGNQCNGDLVCVGGVCQVDQDTVVTCDTSNDNTCQTTVCVPSTGQCAPNFAPAGVACDDASNCTLSDACNGAGVCAGTAKNCDDGLFCNGTEGCNPLIAGGCTAGTPPTIDDGVACTQDFCDEVNDVVQHTPNHVFCDDGNVCTINQCDTTQGCTVTNSTASCDDGVFCTTDDKCENGQCEGGPPAVDSCSCSVDSDCPERTIPGDLCSATYYCDLIIFGGKCRPNNDAVTCSSDNDTQCAKAACDPGTGGCALVPRAQGFPCDDGNLCTNLDQCQGDGTCSGTAAVCSDGQFCNGVEACDANSGICQPGTAPNTNDGIPCTTDSCDEVNDAIVNTPVHADCDDSQFCNGAEQCSAASGCVAGTAPTCDDSNPCTLDSCDADANNGLGGCDFSQPADSCDGATCSGEHALTGGDDDCGIFDACVGGVDGGNGRCTTICPTCAGEHKSGLLNRTIPNNTGGCVVHSMAISMPGVSTPSTSAVNLRVDVSHATLGDLEATLISPDGRSVALLDNQGAGLAHTHSTYSSTTFQSAADSVTPLCKLHGSSPLGTWRLRVCDNLGGAGGTLERVGLWVDASSTPVNRADTCEDAQDISSADGDNTFFGETTCANHEYTGACGGTSAGERIYRFTLNEAKRVQITVNGIGYDAVVYLRPGDNVTCANIGSIACADAAGTGQDEVLQRDLPPGVYYLFVDGANGEEGSFSVTTTFTTLQANGTACSVDTQCLSGICTDGVCCNLKCAGACRACNLGGKEGICSFHAVATDPETECSACQVCSGTGNCINAAAGTDVKNNCSADDPFDDGNGNKCRLDGTCDGNGGCRLHQPPTVCQLGRCENNVEIDDLQCNGSGDCQIVTSRECRPYVCGTGTKCLTNCSSDTDCHNSGQTTTTPSLAFDAFYCTASTCQRKKINGITCGGANECQSGLCVDGVCCNNDCTGNCRACNITGFEGQCTNHLVGTDPEADCGECDYCDGNGACAVVPDGTDPLNHCTAEAEATCGRDGQCNGLGSCRLWSQPGTLVANETTICEAQKCLGHTKHFADTCDGANTCDDNGTEVCAGRFLCNATATDCRNTCSSDSHCQGPSDPSPAWCNPAGGTCDPRRANGATCDQARQCLSGNCTDGYCCDTACGENCAACDISGSEGTCTNFPNGSDPDDDCGVCDECDGNGSCKATANGTDPRSECAQDAAATCNQDGQCDGAGECRKWASGTECQQETCSAGTHTSAFECNGTGSCLTTGTTDCSPYNCNGTSGGCADSTTGKIVYATLNENTGLTAGNTGSNTSSLQLHGATWGGGKTAGGLSFDGTDDFAFLHTSDACGDLTSFGGSFGSADVCGSSEESNGCSGARTFIEAVNFCANAGGRLCTVDELEANETRGTGCGYDAQAVWSSTPCGDGEYWVAAGSTANAATFPTECKAADATNTYVRCCADASPNQDLAQHLGATSSFSYEAWIYPTANVGTLISAGPFGHHLRLATGTLEASCGGSTISTTTSVPLNSWSHAVYTFDGTTDPPTHTFYLDSTEISQVQDDVGVNCRSSESQPLSIGAFLGNDIGSHFKGRMDNVAVYNRTLTSAEVTAHFNACDGAGQVCLASCSTNSHCDEDSWCNNGTCVARKALGETCAAGFQCVSGNCADGVCCDTACDGLCVACSAAGACGPIAANTDPADECPLCQTCDGTFTDATIKRNASCAVVPDGEDYASDCTQSLIASCGHDGKCDGASACRFWAVGRVCDDNYCDPNAAGGPTEYADDLCDGAGTCDDGGSTSCGRYNCVSALTRCRTACSQHDHCYKHDVNGADGNYCSSSECVAKKTNGETCGADIACQSGHCVDGYCCESACGGTCESCRRPGQQGQCVAITDNTDPEADCSTCQVCNGARACRNVGDGLDPTNDCDQAGPTTCGFDGKCAGDGTCRYWADTTGCEVQTCSGSTLHPADFCDGAGSCADSGTQNCPSGFTCNDAGNACRTACSTQAHCQSASHYCAAPSCQPKKANGGTCSEGFECASGQCVDGFCCNSACGGTCEACNVSGAEGTCSPIANGADPLDECGTCQVCSGNRSCRAANNGTDPKNQCDQQSTASCGLDGQCDGAGACRKWLSGTECVAQSCSGTTYKNPQTCDGSGTCSNPVNQSCSPYVCSGDVCLTQCSNDNHCVGTHYCGGNQCKPKKANGGTCVAGNECTSGNCADGVCCDTACDGNCVACNQSGSVGSCKPYAANTDPENTCSLCTACSGTFSASPANRDSSCTNVASGSDPLGECNDDGAASCDRTGVCNGAGACSLYASGTVCNPQSCTGNTRILADTCNGTGTCNDNGTQTCPGNLRCNGAGTDCLGSCTQDSHCVSTHYCSGNSCVPKKANGGSCSGGNECTSGQCADGVCCNSACGGTCERCDTGTVGLCEAIAANTDPQNDCPTCQACNGARACTNVASGTDPINDCSQQSTSTCGRNGQCNGSGACQLWVNNTVCKAQECIGATLHSPDRCNGGGTCNDGGSSTCANGLTCNAAMTGCRTSCSSDSHCQSGFWCGTDGTCKALKPNGQTCTGTAGFDPTGNNQCSSGNCIDGYCCNTTCGGTCQACNISGKQGTCSNHANNSDPEGECSGTCKSCNGAGACSNTSANIDPEGECSAQSTSTCGRTGQCSGSGTCQLYNASTVCQSQSCSNGTLQTTDLCNGSGTCVNSGSVTCGGFQCASSTQCRNSCSNDGHCMGTHYCSGGDCVAKKSNGNSCSANNQCSSGQCVDGVCCNNSCSGECRACNRPGSVGTCTMMPSNQDPAGECGHCRVCNGSGACVNVGSGSDPLNQCSAQAASTCGRDGTCNGAGACRLHADGTTCVGASCSGLTLTPRRTCNGSGTCRTVTNQNCNDGNSCTNDFCNTGGNGSCSYTNKSVGTTCGSGSCGTQSCLARGGCTLWTKPPTCKDVAGTWHACQGNGTQQCKSSTTCKSVQCDPSAGCVTKNFAAGVQVDHKICTDGPFLDSGETGKAAKTYGVYRGDDVCNGAGGVTDGGRVSCFPYRCNGNLGGHGATASQNQADEADEILSSADRCRSTCYNGSGASNTMCATGETCQVSNYNSRFVCTQNDPP